MSKITFADVVTEELYFDKNIPWERLVLELIDSKWVQRLRDIGQTGNTKLVYMFSEHSRFGHSLGVAHLACKLLRRFCIEGIKLSNPSFQAEAEKYAPAIAAAALLHDIGHLAPGSHTAFKAWFPNNADEHEQIAVKIIQEDPEIQDILTSYDDSLIDLVCQILSEDDSLPPWTWQIISGSGWNVDRGNWCIADSVLAGVSYGKYNISALINSIVIDQNQCLALKENRLDAMFHFAVSRHAMYKQIYQHRVILVADALMVNTIKRLKNLSKASFFADDLMLKILAIKSPAELTLSDIYQMRESWWRYHLLKWTKSEDEILRDLSERIFNRRLFKTIKHNDQEDYGKFYEKVKSLVLSNDLDPKYYLYEISSIDRFKEDKSQSLRVLRQNGESISYQEADEIFKHIFNSELNICNKWLAVPEQIKIEYMER